MASEEAKLKAYKKAENKAYYEGFSGDTKSTYNSNFNAGVSPALKKAYDDGVADKDANKPFKVPHPELGAVPVPMSQYDEQPKGAVPVPINAGRKKRRSGKKTFKKTKSSRRGRKGSTRRR